MSLMGEKQTYQFSIAETSVKTTVAYTQQHVEEWMGSRPVKRKISRFTHLRRRLSLGICSYWRKNHSKAHTLAISLGKRVLVVDLESSKGLPNSLKSLLLKSKVHGLKTSVQRTKMGFLRLSFGAVEDIPRKFKNLVDQYPETKDRDIAKNKTGQISGEAARLASSEAFGCFSLAEKE